MMKSQHIPEHKMNLTTTAGQAIENMTSNGASKHNASEKTEAKQENTFS